MKINIKQSDITTYLAQKRTKLANVRTFLSYIRTALILISAGLAFYKIEKKIDYITTILFSLSAVVLILGIIHFIVTNVYVDALKDD